MRERFRIQRRTHRGPDLRKRRLDLGNGGAGELNARIAPGRHALFRVADPIAAHAKTGNECGAPVNDDGLAMIAAEYAEGVEKVRRIITADLDAV